MGLAGEGNTSNGQNVMLRATPIACDAWGPWNPGYQACSVPLCDYCAYADGTSNVCEQCVPGSRVRANGTCSVPPASGTCAAIGLPPTNSWLTSYCETSWAADGTHRLLGGSCPYAVNFCECLSAIDPWAHAPDTWPTVSAYQVRAEGREGGARGMAAVPVSAAELVARRDGTRPSRVAQPLARAEGCSGPRGPVDAATPAARCAAPATRPAPQPRPPSNPHTTSWSTAPKAAAAAAMATTCWMLLSR